MANLNIKDTVIGSGVRFPFQISTKDGKTGVYPVTGDINLIEDNIRSFMVYPKGFRFRHEEYGNILESYLEEPNTQALIFLIKANLRTLISTYEPRVQLTKISTQSYESWLLGRLHYSLVQTPIQAYTDIALNRNI